MLVRAGLQVGRESGSNQTLAACRRGCAVALSGGLRQPVRPELIRKRLKTANLSPIHKTSLSPCAEDCDGLSQSLCRPGPLGTTPFSTGPGFASPPTSPHHNRARNRLGRGVDLRGLGARVVVDRLEAAFPAVARDRPLPEDPIRSLAFRLNFDGGHFAQGESPATERPVNPPVAPWRTTSRWSSAAPCRTFTTC